MSLSNVEPNPSLEKPHYYSLSVQQLENSEDAEALLVRAASLWQQSSNEANLKAWKLVSRAAVLGHPVALGYRLKVSENTEDKRRAIALFTDSAERKHPLGIHAIIGSLLTASALLQIAEMFDISNCAVFVDDGSLEYYRTAASIGLKQAALAVALKYKDGRGVKPNEMLAECYARIADRTICLLSSVCNVMMS
jgi:TPR repeat protein